MLPPVQAFSRSLAGFQDASLDASAASAGMAGAVEPNIRVDEDASAAIAGRINMLMSGRDSLQADLVAIVTLIGAAIGIERQPGEGDASLVQRFVTALSRMSEGQQQALQSQLSDLFKGLQLQTLLNALSESSGPEAALLTAYMEIRRANQQDLNALSAVSSYSQNEASQPQQTTLTVSQPVAAEGQQGAQGSVASQPALATEAMAATAQRAGDGLEAARTGVTTPPAAPAVQTIGTSWEGDVALQGPSAGATALLAAPMEETLERGAGAALPQSLAAAATVGEAETTQALPVKAVSAGMSDGANALPLAQTAQGEKAPLFAQQVARSADPAASSFQDEAGLYTHQLAQSVSSASSGSGSVPLNAPTVLAASVDGEAGQGQTSAAQPRSGDARALQTFLQQELSPDAARRLAEAMRQTEAARAQEENADFTGIFAMKGWTEAAHQPSALVMAVTEEGDEALLRQMLFSAGQRDEATPSGPSSQAARLGELFAESAVARDAAGAELSRSASSPAQAEGRVDASPRNATQAAASTMLSQALMQGMAHMMPATLPQAVPLPVVSYLSMQEEFGFEESEDGIEAVESLSDEEKGRGRSRHGGRDDDEAADRDAEDERSEEGDEIAQDNAFLSTVALEQAASGEQITRLEIAAMGTPVSGPPAIAAMVDLSQPEQLYWRIADLA
ncbi:hypothetical protein [Allorhizobium undicola]|uniref:hypothetical protein n=1 Tax=Allorhizobium undicola TaxID=78527 RepID=UPI0004860C67|nr:hypothetical protein [Allorhizobium undicola]